MDDWDFPDNVPPPRWWHKAAEWVEGWIMEGVGLMMLLGLTALGIMAVVLGPVISNFRRRT